MPAEPGLILPRGDKRGKYEPTAGKVRRHSPPEPGYARREPKHCQEGVTRGNPPVPPGSRRRGQRRRRDKKSHGIGFVDPEREEWMLQYLQRANRGPVSADALREFFQRILELTKREVSD